MFSCSGKLILKQKTINYNPFIKAFLIIFLWQKNINKIILNIKIAVRNLYYVYLCLRILLNSIEKLKKMFEILTSKVLFTIEKERKDSSVKNKEKEYFLVLTLEHT